MGRIRYSPLPPIAKTGRWRSSHAMLLTSTSPPPNRIAGRRIAYGMPVLRRYCSTSALPAKYGKGELRSAWVMETCTTRSTPARLAASNRTRLLATAWAWVLRPRENRTQ